MVYRLDHELWIFQWMPWPSVNYRISTTAALTALHIKQWHFCHFCLLTHATNYLILTNIPRKTSSISYNLEDNDVQHQHYDCNWRHRRCLRVWKQSWEGPIPKWSGLAPPRSTPTGSLLQAVCCTFHTMLIFKFSASEDCEFICSGQTWKKRQTFQSHSFQMITLKVKTLNLICNC